MTPKTSTNLPTTAKDNRHRIIMKNSTPVLTTLRRLTPHRNDSTPRRLFLACLVLLTLLGVSARAATISKANNADNLVLGSSWVLGTAPGSGDIAQWDSTVTSANTTILGADTNWSGIIITNTGGLVTINAGNTLTIGSAGIDLTNATADMTLNCGINLAGANTWPVGAGRKLTVGGVVSGGSVSTLAKLGDGTLILNGNNAGYSGAITVSRGVVSIGDGNALGTSSPTVSGTGLAALYLGGGISVANPININGAAVLGVAAYGNLRSLTGANTWSGKISMGGSPRIGCDFGTLNFTGGIDIASTRTVTFVGAGDIVVSSVIAKAGSGTASQVESIDKRLGPGTLKLSSATANTYDGRTTLYQGTLLLDYSAGNVNRIPNASANAVVILSGGTLTLNGGGYAEELSSTTIGAALAGGAASVARSSGGSTLRLNAITRNTGSTVDFGAVGIADTDTADVNGILGGYATIAGADWAHSGTTAANTPITALAAYETNPDPTQWTTATTNVSLAGNPLANVPTTTINALRLTAASTVQIDPAATLTLSSGGLLVTGSGATAIAPASGTATLAGASGKDLIVHQNSSADLTISATIADNATATSLTKSGSGRLVLSADNTYTGTNFVAAGTLSISTNSNLGSQTAGTPIIFAGGTLQATATFALDNSGANKRNIGMGETTTSTIDVTGGNTLTVSGNIDGRGWLTKTGSGTLVLSGINTYTGDTALNGGIMNLGVAEVASTSGPLGWGTSATLPGVSALISFGGGTLQYSAVNTYDYSLRFSAAAGQAYKVDTAGQNVAWATGLVSAGGSLSKAGLGTLTLSGASTYNGGTTVSAGTLALSGIGAINSSAQLSLAAGATFDVSALSSPYNLSSSTALSASGTGTTVGSTAAAINGPLAGTVNLGTQPITLAYDGSNPALYVPQGTLQVQGNAWTINGSALSPSTTYTIVSQVGGTASVSGIHTVYGTAILGMTGTISGSGANVQLTTSAALTATTTTVGSSANPSTYGTAPTFTATVNGAGATGTVLFVLDGVPQLPAATLSGGTATFTAANSLSAGAHTVVAQYGGDATYGSSVSTAFSQTVNPKALTIGGLVPGGSKVYDGTTQVSLSGTPSFLASEAFGTGSSTDGKPYTGDVVGITGLATGTYNSKDVATATTVTFSGLTLNGAQAANYTVQGTAAATITPKPLTVTAAGVNRSYDGTTNATVNLSDDKVAGDTVTESYTSAYFADKNAGTGKPVAVEGIGISGADAGNYSLASTTANTTANITPAALTVTAQPDSKVYDGTTNSAATPTITSGSIQTGDTAPTWTQTYATKHVGTGKTLTPAGLVVDGNGGANYNYTYATDVTGVISQTNITVTATANTKGYDGNTSAAAIPAITFGSVQTGDTPNFTETYDTPSVGTGKTLTPAGTVIDGNTGLNYNYTFVPVNTGVITNVVTCSATNYILSIVNLGAGSYQLNFQGTEGAKYYVVTSSAVSTAMSSWTAVVGSTNTAGTGGLWSATVSGAAPAYYRGVAESPCP
jgi:autotransporter-associated beta strand protein